VHLNIVEVRKPEIDANAGRRQHRPAAGAPCRVPPRHEAGCSVCHADGRRGHPYQLRAVWAVLKSRVPNGIAKAACRCTRCAPTSTTVPHTAHTAYGVNGIKVWIFKGEILEHDPMASEDKRSSRCRKAAVIAPAP
jgi:small subunit ribosomal protein S3